jgi:hypothetical protein
MGGRLLPNARGAYWFLKLRHPKKAHRHLMASAAGGPGAGTRSAPRSRQILVIVQSLIFGRRLPRPDPRKSQRSA